MQSLALWVSMLDLHVHGFARKYESHVSLSKLKSVMVPYCLRISLEINLFLVSCLFNIVIKMVLYTVG
jgi:p-aminobenzoyl-glutamate transporter AbgT